MGKISRVRRADWPFAGVGSAHEKALSRRLWTKWQGLAPGLILVMDPGPVFFVPSPPLGPFRNRAQLS